MSANAGISQHMSSKRPSIYTLVLTQFLNETGVCMSGWISRLYFHAFWELEEMCVCHHTRHRVSSERAEFIMTILCVCVCVCVCVCSCVKSDRVDIDRHEHSSLLMKHTAGSSHRTITEL